MGDQQRKLLGVNSELSLSFSGRAHTFLPRGLCPRRSHHLTDPLSVHPSLQTVILLPLEHLDFAALPASICLILFCLTALITPGLIFFFHLLTFWGSHPPIRTRSFRFFIGQLPGWWVGLGASTRARESGLGTSRNPAVSGELGYKAVAALPGRADRRAHHHRY